MDQLKYKILLLLVAGLMINCSARLIKKDQLKGIQAKYAGIYSLKKDTDIGNNSKWPKGKVIMVYFRVKSDAIMVYGFDSKKAREQAVGKNILTLLQTDFKDNIYDEAYINKRLTSLLQPITIK